jgi:hypothetical protein
MNSKAYAFEKDNLELNGSRRFYNIIDVNYK